MMANQGSKPSLDGIVRTRPAGQNITQAQPVKPSAPQKPVRPAPRPAVAEPSQPKLVRRPVASVEEDQFVDEPQEKGHSRKVIKTLVVLLVLAAFAFGIWWVYLSYFA